MNPLFIFLLVLNAGFLVMNLVYRNWGSAILSAAACAAMMSVIIWR
jgi:hypothetical protein